MAEIFDSAAARQRSIREAFDARREYIIDNQDNLTVKGLMRLLEADLGMEKRALKADKGLIMELLDGMVDASTPPPKQAPEEEDALDTDEVSGDPGSDPQPQVKKRRRRPVEENEADAPKRNRRDSEGSADASVEAEEEGKEGKEEGEGEGRKRRRGKGDEEGEGEEEGEESDGEREREEEGKGKRRGKGKGKASVKKQSETEQLRQNKANRLKQICKLARIGISPHVYVEAAGDAGKLYGLLSDLLANHGLSPTSTPSEIRAVRQRRELAMDLDGIDEANIMDSSPGRRRARREDAGGQEEGVGTARKAAVAPEAKGTVLDESDDEW